MKRVSLFTAVAFLILCGKPAYAQWLEQTITLHEGWNSIYLEVDPWPERADDVFGNHPIESVWMWVNPLLIPRATPDCQEPNDEDADCKPSLVDSWRVWFPGDKPHGFLLTLRVVRGGHVYLIRARKAGTLTLRGRPSVSFIRWRPGFNLVGFHVGDDPSEAPTFADYLGPSAAGDDMLVYTLHADGNWVQIGDFRNTQIEPGRGYWVHSKLEMYYDGPVVIDGGSARGIDFAQSLVTHSLTLRNLSPSPKVVSVSYLPSLQPPTQPASAGDVPLSWLDYGSGDQVNEIYQWLPLGSHSWELAGAGEAGDHVMLRLAVRRSELAAAVLDAQRRGQQYQGILRVSDDIGVRRYLRVTMQVAPGAVAGKQNGPGKDMPPRSSLWVGHVVVNEVQWITAGVRHVVNDDRENEFQDPQFEASSDDDSSALRPTASEFSFPVIIHENADGECRLLSEVVIMWRDGEGGEDGDYVVVSPECPPEIRAELKAGSEKDGEPFSRRLSSAAFSFDGDLRLTGDGFGSRLLGNTIVSSEHRLNPFRHTYHPDHDGDQAGEVYQIGRSLMFTFDTEQPDDDRLPGWGDTYITGIYSETLSGLYKNDISVRGSFRLYCILKTATTLNAQ